MAITVITFTAVLTVRRSISKRRGREAEGPVFRGVVGVRGPDSEARGV